MEPFLGEVYWSLWHTIIACGTFEWGIKFNFINIALAQIVEILNNFAKIC